MPASSEVSVVLPAHLHARPAGAVVRAAAGFQSTIEIRYGDRDANARGILALLGLGATAGETVVVRATGEDAAEAAAAIAELLSSADV
jgi:phosphotransferase system HPr (HPr) family protein